MKKLIVALGVCLVNSVCAQWAGSSGVTNPIYRTDAVGIGMTSAPGIPLVVREPSGNGTKVGIGTTAMITSGLGSGDACVDTYGSTAAVHSLFCGTSGSEHFLQFTSTTNYGIGIHTGKRGGVGPFPDLTISCNGNNVKLQNDGKFVVGTVASTPGTYKLYVEDGILTEKVKVAIDGSGNWSDYVFAPEYKLRSLKEVDAFIKKNRHLPGVPSAEEVVASGIDVATMDAKLLEKIEELTLYIINLEKKLEVQQQQLETLKNQTNRK